ncbi:hypothetical protein [Lactococcus formosensis]|uniref:YdhG-like domain-containing protein n=1 Tax=Lactococcus formosensis TaxID=1281486 RepID=A0A9X4SEB5_9LACT|nr:hypothetical protein [Lactococcus formosensis]MCO7180535.1 hypothetical protein [Lactococcus formosensis]MDG6112098.1 hypothetical protein [Lactococcus formosensis]MDG6112644.1 hypothetical protein [Lactococcus formosensis]MDG6115346.1 hypothetical protein [Lactococcus formosensis]MDG6118298.1 hypothetical protein [Lactococcus formosensis]
MKKAQPFETYFNDEDLEVEKLTRMQLTRQLVHTIYPDVQERVSYAMPGFYPKEAKKATQQLFLLMANKGWLGIYGTQGMEENDFSSFTDYNIEFGKGSLKVPYDMPESELKNLLQLIMNHNAKKNGFDIS